MPDDLSCLLLLLAVPVLLGLVGLLQRRCSGDTESTLLPCRNRPEQGGRRCHLHDDQLVSKADLVSLLLLLGAAAAAWLWWTGCR